MKTMQGRSIKTGESPETKLLLMRAVFSLYRCYIHLPAQNAFMVNPSTSKRERRAKTRVQTSRMKTYCPSLERNGGDSGFIKSALCVLEVDDKSLFSMSGNAGSLKL